MSFFHKIFSTCNFTNCIKARCSSAEINDVTFNKISDASNIEKSVSTDENLQNSVLEEDIQKYLANETGWQRLRSVISDIPGAEHPIYQMVTANLYAATFVGMLFGFVKGRRSASELFVKKNISTKFTNKYAAVRSYVNATMFGGMRHAIILGSKCFFFSSFFIIPSTAISIYRNKTTPLEFITSAALACSLWRFSLGPRGMLAGGLIGFFMGIIPGCLIWALLTLTHTSVEDIHKEEIIERIKNDRKYFLMKQAPL